MREGWDVAVAQRWVMTGGVGMLSDLGEVWSRVSGDGSRAIQRERRVRVSTEGMMKSGVRDRIMVLLCE